MRPRLGPTLAGLGGGLVLVVVPLHAWSGPHTFDQLLRSRAAVSLATPWRTALQAGAPRWLISVGAALLAVALAGALLRLTRPGPGATWASGAVAAGAAGGAAEPDGGGDPSDDGGDPSDGGGDPRSGGAPTAFWLLAALATAYSLAASYTLPWYDLLAWGALPAVASAVRLPVLDAVALTRLAVVSAAYVPGRVLGMTEGVRTVTMGVRRGMAPWVAAALWAAVLSLAWRAGSGRPPGRRPRGS